MAPGKHKTNKEEKKNKVSKQRKVSNSKKRLHATIDKPDKQLKNMEVYHPHGIHRNRKLKDYVFEFIMLFVAITGGFFMENMRENLVERHQGKEYIVRLISDIKADTTTIHRLIHENQWQITGIDSLLSFLRKPLPEIRLEELIERSVKYLNNYNGFTPRDITMTQLKNSGGLRLIKNNSVADSIINYYSTIEYYHELNVTMNYKYIEDTYKLELGFFDFSPGMKNKSLSKTEMNKLTELYNRGYGFKANIGWDNHWLNDVYKQGASLLKYLEKEYKVNESE
jgi:hypothetical protein